MHIGSGLNTVSSLYGQQKGNQMKTPASGGKGIYYGRNTGGISDIHNR